MPGLILKVWCFRRGVQVVSVVEGRGKADLPSSTAVLAAGGVGTACPSADWRCVASQQVVSSSLRVAGSGWSPGAAAGWRSATGGWNSGAAAMSTVSSAVSGAAAGVVALLAAAASRIVLDTSCPQSRDLPRTASTWGSIGGLARGWARCIGCTPSWQIRGTHLRDGLISGIGRIPA